MALGRSNALWSRLRKAAELFRTGGVDEERAAWMALESVETEQIQLRERRQPTPEQRRKRRRDYEKRVRRKKQHEPAMAALKIAEVLANEASIIGDPRVRRAICNFRRAAARVA